MSRPRTFVAASVLILLAAAGARAELSRSDRKAAKSLFSGTLYMRIDAPCEVGRQPFGIYYSPVVKISPEGSEDQGDGGLAFGFYHFGGTQLTIRVNDPVELDEIDFDEDEVEIELDGRGSADDEHTAILFVRVRNLDDFRSAFERTFSPVPLQDEHPEWPAEIRSTIAERRLVDGMSKRQAYYVTGAPERFDRFEEDGKQVEVWTLRDDARVKVGFFRTKIDTEGGSAETIRFEDGLLVGAGSSGDRNDFSLDDP